MAYSSFNADVWCKIYDLVEVRTEGGREEGGEENCEEEGVDLFGAYIALLLCGGSNLPIPATV